jgi:signal transduction histidine kinase
LEDSSFHPDLTAGHYVNLQISDSGQGMTQDVLKQFFTRLLQLKRLEKGMVWGFLWYMEL